VIPRYKIQGPDPFDCSWTFAHRRCRYETEADAFYLDCLLFIGLAAVENCSPGHKKNILSEQPNFLGAGCSISKNEKAGMDKFYCVQLFFDRFGL
jgi:hypothetical protein